MYRLKLGVGLFAFFTFLCAHVPAQEIPEEAKRGIAQNLEGSFIVYREAVQAELKLSDDQKEKLDEHLRELLPEAMQFFQSLADLSGEVRDKKHQAFRQKAEDKLKAVLKGTLKEEQNKRLRQLWLQKEGAFALFHGGPEIAREIKITDEQRKQFMPVVQALLKKVEPLVKEAQNGGNPEEIRPKVLKIRKEHEEKVEALLSDAQKKQWKEMLGKPFVLEE